MTHFDWPDLLRAGLFQLGLKPAEFWALTPIELSVMLGQGGPPALGRDRLTDLMDTYPDQREGTQDG